MQANARTTANTLNTALQSFINCFLSLLLVCSPLGQVLGATASPQIAASILNSGKCEESAARGAETFPECSVCGFIPRLKEIYPTGFC
jgi:hypothetical protein